MSDVEDPDNPRLTVEDIKEIMSYDPESEVDRLDEELQRQIQWKLEACKKAEDLQSKLTEMEQCLQWCSEHVQCVQPINWTSGKEWAVAWQNNHWTQSPTLYAALKSAWEGRDK